MLCRCWLWCVDLVFFGVSCVIVDCVLLRASSWLFLVSCFLFLVCSFLFAVYCLSVLVVRCLLIVVSWLLFGVC